MKKIIFFLPVVFGLMLVACNKKFDEPPPYEGRDVQPNLSIRDLRAMHYTGNFEKLLDEFIIEGIVIANDSSDNFYKSVVLQDSTGGITVRLDGFGLYNTYPVGLQLCIRLKDLWLGDYAKMIQLGAGVDRSDSLFPELLAVPQPLFDRYFIRKNLHQPVQPRIARLDELGDSLQSCLVKINGVEFATADTGKSYADAVNKLSVNRTVKACGGGTAYVRSSGFANFASLKTPRGNGSVTAVYTVFRNEKQLLIRDTADVQLSGLRCTGPGVKLLLYEDFEPGPTPKDTGLPGWKNFAETGGKPWQTKSTNGNGYAEINAFATNQPAVISWLVSPPVNLSNSANEVLSFLTKDGFDNGGVLQVYVSTNYDGGNSPWKAKWTALKASISKGSAAGVAANWQASGNVSLAGFPGTVHIGFRYDGADPVNPFDKRTTSFQLDNVKIEGN
ncbi:MAG: hypothetical protein JWQ78_1412 [Sediminibacterium sp.]|nr:hypothetical protein [Sediminibacterium sp.]